MLLRMELPPPMWSHPPWFYRVVAGVLIVLCLCVLDWFSRH